MIRSQLLWLLSWPRARAHAVLSLAPSNRFDQQVLRKDICLRFSERNNGGFTGTRSLASESSSKKGKSKLKRKKKKKKCKEEKKKINIFSVCQRQGVPLFSLRDIENFYLVEFPRRVYGCKRSSAPVSASAHHHFLCSL